MKAWNDNKKQEIRAISLDSTAHRQEPLPHRSHILQTLKHTTTQNHVQYR